MLESELQTRVIEVLKLATYIPIRVNSGGRVGRVRLAGAGTPDIIALGPGSRVLLIELKTDTGKVSEVQQAWHDKARLYGHDVWIVRNLDDLERALTCNARRGVMPL